MKILVPPSSGKIGDRVAFKSRYGMAMRIHGPQRNPRTFPQQRMRRVFGGHSQGWGRRLSQEQRDRWNVAGPQVMSHPRCGQFGPLTGEQHYTGINSVLGCVGLPPLWEPPARVVFGLSPVRELVITNDEGGARLFLRLAAPPTEDIMVFGQAPCSAGRNKRRNVSYLGLLRPSEDGLSEITAMYKAKYGEPRPGMKVFIVTCQQKNGWQGLEFETSEIVPNGPAGQQAVAEVVNSQKPLMHKGCTRDAEGTGALVDSYSPGGIEPEDGGGKAAGAGLEGRKVPDEEGDAPG